MPAVLNKRTFMQLINSDLFSKIKNSYTIKNGIVYFFENFFVTEINEGVVQDFENSKDLIPLVDLHFGTDKPFGIISNRINSFSINLLDSEKFRERYPNAIAKAVVSYSEQTTKLFHLESHFCDVKRKEFKCLLESEKWITNELNILKEVI